MLKPPPSSPSLLFPLPSAELAAGPPSPLWAGTTRWWPVGAKEKTLHVVPQKAQAHTTRHTIGPRARSGRPHFALPSRHGRKQNGCAATARALLAAARLPRIGTMILVGRAAPRRASRPERHGLHARRGEYSRGGVCNQMKIAILPLA